MFPKRVGHFVSRYPKKSETFIQSDIAAWNLMISHSQVFAFFKDQGDPPPEYIKKIHYLKPGRIYIKSQIKWLLAKPLTYMSLFFEIMCGYLFHPKEMIKILVAWPLMIHAATLIQKENLDAVHAHWGNVPATTTYVISKLLNLPYVFTLHAFDIYKKNTFLEHKLKKAQMVMTCTEYNRRHLLKTYPFLDESKIKLAYHGVNLDLFEIKPQKLKDSPFILLTIGRMTAQKGFPTLIKALKLLKDQKIQVKLKFLGLKGAKEKEIHELIDEFKLKDMIEWIDPTPKEKMASLYQSAHVTVLACELSKDGSRDGIPNVFLESMSCGVPVISTNISGIPEVLKDQVTGLVVRPKDPEGLAEAIIKLINDPSLLEQCGKNARKLIEKEHDQKVCHQKIVQYLKEVYE